MAEALGAYAEAVRIVLEGLKKQHVNLRIIGMST